MQNFYCNAFKLNKGLKVINNVLTTSDKDKIVGKPILSPCGDFYLDSSVFKIDESTKAITRKENNNVTKVIQTYCGNIKLDGDSFNINKGIVDLTEKVNFVPNCDITFEALDNFDMTLKDETGLIINPTKDNFYEVEKGKTYHYVANNKEKEINGDVTTNGRKIHFLVTLEF